MTYKFPCNPSLSRKFNLLLISASVLTLLLTLSLNLAFRYQKTIENQQLRIETAAQLRLPKLAGALWNIDPVAIRQELESFTDLPGVSWVELTTSLGRTQARGKVNLTHAQQAEKTLILEIYQQENRTRLGTLTLHIKTQPILDGLQYEILLTAGTQLLQLLILLVLGNLLLRRLILARIRQQTGDLHDVHLDSLAATSVPLETVPSKNELDQLFTALSHMQHRLAQELQARCHAEKAALEEQIRLEGEVARRAGEAVYLTGFLKQLSRLSSDFLILPSEHMDTALRDALHEISVFLGLDTSFIVAIGADDQAEIRSFWRKDTLPVAPLEAFLSHQRNDYAASFALLNKEKSVQIHSSQLPVNSLEARLSALLQLESIALVRLESPEQTIGLLCGGMSETIHTLSDMERRLLSMTGNIVANLLLHRQEQARIKNAETELCTVRRQLAALTKKDQITGLSNAENFHSTLTHELRRAERTGSPIALILLEIDQFVEYGHPMGGEAGNEVLCAVAQEISRLTSRSGDLSAHLDDQRFAVLLPETTPDGALALTRHLLGNLTSQHLAHSDHRITASIALLRQTKCVHSDPTLLLHQAEQTLQQAQLNGGNRIEIFDADTQ